MSVLTLQLKVFMDEAIDQNHESDYYFNLFFFSIVRQAGLMFSFPA